MAGFSAIALGIGILGAVGQFATGIQQQKQAKKAQKAQDAVNREQNRRSKVQALRQAQVLRSSAVNTAGATGGGFSSGIAGGTTSVGSQVGAELGHASQLSGLNEIISSAAQKSARLGAIGGAFGSVSNLGFFGYNNAGALQSTFGVNKAPLPSRAVTNKPVWGYM